MNGELTNDEIMFVEGIDEKIIGRQQEYGTVNAVYTFLQGQLGVRWLWPGELGEDIPRRKQIAFEPFEYRYHPQMRARGGAFNFSALSDKGYGRAFGPAAANVRAYSETIEKARMAYVKQHGYGGGVFNFLRLYTDDLLSESREQLRLAAAKFEIAPEIYRRRVAFIRAGLTYSELLIETIRLMESYWRKKDDAVAKTVVSNWDELDRLCKEHPFAIN